MLLLREGFRTLAVRHRPLRQPIYLQSLTRPRPFWHPVYLLVPCSLPELRRQVFLRGSGRWQGTTAYWLGRSRPIPLGGSARFELPPSRQLVVETPRSI